MEDVEEAVGGVELEKLLLVERGLAEGEEHSYRRAAREEHLRVEAAERKQWLCMSGSSLTCACLSRPRRRYSTEPLCPRNDGAKTGRSEGFPGRSSIRR